jgi:putative sterol carrier protein
MADKTARQLIENMPEVFRPQRARGASAVIQFELSGDDGGNWYVTVKDGACTVTEGESGDAQATIMMDASDYVALATGKLGGMRAFMTGKVKTKGDFTLLQKMQSWFPQK